MYINLKKGFIAFFVVLLPVLLYAKDTLKPDSSIYYVTNRGNISTGDSVQFDNSIDPNHTMSYGKRIRDNGFIESKQFSNLDAVFADIPKSKNILIFVHGAGKTFEGAMDRAFQTRDLYDVAIIVFTYPTHDPLLKPGDDLRKAIENADSSAGDFHRFLIDCTRIINNNKEDNDHRNVSLLFHSLGNYLLERSVEGVFQEVKFENQGQRPFENLLMVAAAVDSRQHAAWMNKLAFQKNLLVISNKHDLTLTGAKFLTSWSLQLGQKVKGEQVSWAAYIDFKKTLGFTFHRAPSHSYFYGQVPRENKAVWIFFNEAFNGKNPLDADGIYFSHNNHKNLYNLKEIRK
jgi:hypothetical protein